MGRAHKAGPGGPPRFAKAAGRATGRGDRARAALPQTAGPGHQGKRVRGGMGGDSGRLAGVRQNRPQAAMPGGPSEADSKPFRRPAKGG